MHRLGLDIAATAVLLSVMLAEAEAHEFWIDGTLVQENATELLALDLKVGQNLDGLSLPYIPDTIERFEWVDGGNGAISGNLGETPAARVAVDPHLGAVIFHRTAPRKLLHRDWSKFLDYLTTEGLTGIAEAHERRGLPRTGFSETYTRHAKFVLITPDSRTVQDRYLGSPVEIVLDAVQKDGRDVMIRGHVIENNRPAERQLTAFYIGSNGIAVRRTVPTREGAFALAIPPTGPVLLNAVAMSPTDTSEASWHSDWASMFIRFR